MKLDLTKFYQTCNPAKTIVLGNAEDRKYYIDFWHVIKDENKVDLMNIVTNKNHIWIKKYIQKIN